MKLVFPPAARSRIDQHPALRPENAVAAEQHLVTTYYDTPGSELAEAGVSLRVRASAGRHVQTLKSRGTGAGVTADRGEWEWPLDTDTPDFTLAAATPAGAGLDPNLAQRLEPVFAADIRRAVRRLSLGRGTIVELAIDEGSLRAGDKREPVHELELELKEGPVGPLLQLGLELHADLPLQLEPEAKAARGYRLRTGMPPAPEKAAELRLDNHVSGAEGLRQIAASALGGLLANQPAARAGDAEGVHQMRIAIRRLRAALVVFEPLLEPHAAGRFEDALRRLGRVPGEARDWDVFCQDTLPTALHGPVQEAWGRQLGEAAEAERAKAHHALLAEFARPALTGLALGLSAWIEDPAYVDRDKALQRRLSKLAPALLDRMARKTFKRGRHIEQRSGTELHAVRKSLKKLRYGADYMAGLYQPKAVKTYLKRCKTCQDLLGEINDAAVAEKLAETLSHGSQLDLIPAMSAMMEWSAKQRRKALRRLPKAWDEFRRAEPFWGA